MPLTDMPQDRPKVLVAGIGGASLGTEIIKCLCRADRYTILGCDISPLAFGHYVEGVDESFVVPVDGYSDAVAAECERRGVDAVIPGGEEPLRLLAGAADALAARGVRLAANRPDLIALCTSKHLLFAHLADLEIPTPRTVALLPGGDPSPLHDVRFPCVIKPSVGSGGSRHVFLAADPDEGRLFADRLRARGVPAIVQEYVPLDEGEFTIGVLSRPDATIVGSVAMQRLFHNNLSISSQTEAGLISSGYSQGLIDAFPDLCAQAERIAKALASAGPLNIQARVVNGVLLPFEINPRFSASTYLRAMAGFNEVDLCLRHLLHDSCPPPPAITGGYYLRTFSEAHVTADMIPSSDPAPERAGGRRVAALPS